jgi:hypothetical protein
VLNVAGSGSGGVSLLRRALAVLGLGFEARVGADEVGPGAREEVREAGDYLLRTRILHAGTRSEGRVGRLFRGGVEVPGRTPGEFIDVTTPQGVVRFTYMGEARPHLWAVSGWTDRPAQR